MNEVDRACETLRGCIDEKIPDKGVRDAVGLLIEAHEAAKATVEFLRARLEHAVGLIDRITGRPEFRAMMEESGNGDGEAERGDVEAR